MNRNNFNEYLKPLNLELNDHQLNQLDQYCHLIQTWNEVMNLTTIVSLPDVYLKHFYDSLTLNQAVPLNTISTLCDIGSGAGFPGIVLKIVFPSIKVTLVESISKRCHFLNTVITELGLKDITVVNTRAEDYAINHRNQYDLVTCRAVSSLNVLLEYCVPLCKVGGLFAPLKGNIDDELSNCSNAIKCLDIKLIKNVKLSLPLEFSLRSIPCFIKNKATSQKYPRSYKSIKKNPL